MLSVPYVWNNRKSKTEATRIRYTLMFPRSLSQHQKHLNCCGLRPSLLCGAVAGFWSTHILLDHLACAREEAGKHPCHHVNTTLVPEGVAPTQLGLPVTCIHQPPPGSGCHQQRSSNPLPPWPCPAQVGYVSRLCPSFLTPLFVTAEGCSTFHGRGFIFFPMSHILSRPEPHFFLLVHFFPNLFTSPPILDLESKYKSKETAQFCQESTSVL